VTESRLFGEYDNYVFFFIEPVVYKKMKSGHVTIFVNNRVKHCDSAASQLV